MFTLKHAIGNLLIIISLNAVGQITAGNVKDEPNGNNVFIITLDGLRWQELFKGADGAILNNTFYTKNLSSAKKNYWSDDLIKRRKKLMPFIWNVVAEKGVIIGNKDLGSKVNTENLFYIIPGV
ncbi:MAG: hypothetical protein ACR2KB_14925 [Chitinophagaceae bacterium]